MRYLLFLFLLTALAAGCQRKTTTATTSSDPAQQWLRTTETAHHVADFQAKEAVQFDLTLLFGGEERFRGTVTSLTNSGQVMVKRADGTMLYYDGKDLWQSPAAAEWPGARFAVFTWHYFFMAPFKFSDPGTQWSEIMPRMQDGKSYSSAKLTFDSDIGDSPDDWYIAYTDKDNHLLHTMAYIVTAGGRSAQEAEPHAIVYTDYVKEAGIPIARTWNFTDWSAATGTSGARGSAKVTNVKFVPASAVADGFVKSEAKRIE